MATNIEEIFRSFVVKKIKEIEDEKHQSGKVTNEANGEVKLEVEPKETEVVAGTILEAQIVNNSDHVLSSLNEKQSDKPDNKENVTVDSTTTEQVNCPALDNKEDGSAAAKKSKKHKHKHHHKHKSKKKKKKKRKKDKKRDSRSRSKSQISLKSDSDLKLRPQSQSKSPSKSPLHTECNSRVSENCSLLMKSANFGSNKNAVAEAIDVNTVVPVKVEKECLLSEIKSFSQDNCKTDQHAKENCTVDTNNGNESATTGNISELLAAQSTCEQDQTSKLIHDRSSSNEQSKSSQIVEENNKRDQPEERRTKRSRSRSLSKSSKHHKSQLHSHSHHSPIRKSRASSSSRHESRSSRKRPSPARHRSKSTSRERKKHTESSPKSKRKASRSRSITKKEQRSKSKSRSPLRIRHKSRSDSLARSQCQSKSISRHRSRSSSRSKRRSRTRSGSSRRSRSRVKRSHSPRPKSRSKDRVCHRSASRGYLSQLVRTRRSPDWRRRSRSPLRRSTSRTAERLTDLDKAQLLEIAKANAAAMCAKAGMPLPANLKPVVPLVKEVITKKRGCSSIEEFTEKCKKIVESSDDNELGNKPHLSEEDEPFSSQPIKVNELKPISFSLSQNATVKPTAKTQVALTKEFPVSSGSQHRKKEVLNGYGQWVPVEKTSKETTDDVFPEVSSQVVDISATMSERAAAQKRLVKNPYDVEAMSMILRAQEQIDVWAQANSLPGQFTGSTGVQVLTYEELTHSGPQAWIRKDQFLKAAPLTGGMGAQLMQKMGWREGEGLGKNKNGPVEPIVVDFKTDRKGLVAEGEKTQKKFGNFPILKDLSGKHPVSALIEICNKRKWPPPKFLMVCDSGPDHCKHFLFKVMINGTEYKPSLASPNKKHAKASAATIALQAIGLVPKEGATSATSSKDDPP
ncbi:protein SON-like isoform X1 [Mobula hypostoma]|uniref:protein SON-like isoform X1 n=1 Tax=Mobula hypostoma TaxID=723540 RepID=UPI002FC38D4C